MNTSVDWYSRATRRYYLDTPGWINGTQQFHEMCAGYVNPAVLALELGPGPDSETTRWLTKECSRVFGLDTGAHVGRELGLTGAVVYDGITFPCRDDSFDFVMADYVMEHVESPAELCREVFRVLKPRGAFAFRTPNRFHYVPLFSRFFPDSISAWARRNADHEPEIFPKHYRFNTAKACRSILAVAGFDSISIEIIEKEPSYGRRSRLLFYPMLAYERLVNASGKLAGLRANILCVAVKP